MRYSTHTDASGPDVIARAVETFGPAGHGLIMTARNLLSARFESQVGHVAIEAARLDGQTEVTIETREFDREVKAFIHSLPRRGWFDRLVSRLRGR